VSVVTEEKEGGGDRNRIESGGTEMSRETTKTRKVLELTEKQLRHVIGGDRKPRVPIGPGNGTGNGSREVTDDLWFAKR
jgi:bacteriocin-like protein